MPNLQRWLIPGVLAFLGVAAVTISILVITPVPDIDDVFIGYRYAANWAAGNGICYNAGEPPVEGYTSIGWIALFTLAIKMGLEPLFLTQVVNVIAALVTIPVVYALGRRPERSSYYSLLAPALLAFHISFVAYPMLGMTTSTFALVLALSVLVLARGALDTVRGALGLGGLLLVLSLVRFDGVGLALGLLLYPILIERRIKPVIPAFLVLAIGLAIYNGWRISYYGALLPNTHYAKQSPILQDAMFGLRYIKSFVRDGGPYWALALLGPLAAWRGSRAARVSFWMCCGHLVYTIVVGGDWMPSFRFMLHVLPLYCLLFQEGLWSLRDLAVTRGLSQRQATVAAVVVAVLAFGDNLTTLTSSEWITGREREGPYWKSAHALRIGEHLDESLPADCVIATEWAGFIPSRMRQPVLDILGLNDLDIISRDDFKRSNQGRGVTPEYLASREPELIVVVARIFPTIEEARVGIDARPEGSWIKGLYESVRDYGYEVCVLKIGDEGYWPCLIREGSEMKERLGAVG